MHPQNEHKKPGIKNQKSSFSQSLFWFWQHKKTLEKERNRNTRQSNTCSHNVFQDLLLKNPDPKSYTKKGFNFVSLNPLHPFHFSLFFVCCCCERLWVDFFYKIFFLELCLTRWRWVRFNEYLTVETDDEFQFSIHVSLLSRSFYSVPINNA